jgi:DNA methylase
LAARAVESLWSQISVSKVAVCYVSAAPDFEWRWGGASLDTCSGWDGWISPGGNTNEQERIRSLRLRRRLEFERAPLIRPGHRQVDETLETKAARQASFDCCFHELGRFGRWRSNVWCYPGASSVGSDAREGLAVHPTVKPRALLEDALLDVSARDDIVLEPFAGSGSTLIAAEATDRICRAIEIDGLYCDAIIRRWQEMTGGEAVLEETGETFATIEGQRLREGDF